MTSSRQVPPAAGRDYARLAREGLLWFGAAAGTLCLVLAGLALAFHITPVVFRSGSMSPAISTGSLALTHTVDASDLHVGDVVTVRSSKGVRVTHRIVSITPNGDQATLVLKGDANDIVDSEAYPVASADRVVFSVPQLGYVVSFLGGRAGAFGGGLLIGLVLITAFSRTPRRTVSGLVPVRGYLRPPIFEEPVDSHEPGWRAKPRPKRRTAVIATSLGVLALGLIAGVKGTNAYFQDSATVDSGTFTMKTTPPPAPVITACASANGQTGYTLTFTWAGTALPANTSYEIRYSNVNPAPNHPTQVVAGTSTPTNPHTATTVPVNDESGDIVMVAITPAGTSANSNTVHYAGKNNGKTCTGTIP